LAAQTKGWIKGRYGRTYAKDGKGTRELKSLGSWKHHKGNKPTLEGLCIFTLDKSTSI
jgi:hypothetical protein